MFLLSTQVSPRNSLSLLPPCLLSPFFVPFFDFSFPLLIHLGAASFTFISETNRSRVVFFTSELVTDPKIRSLSWKKSVVPPLLRFQDFSATHASSLYGVFMYIVPFYGYHSTSPSVKLCGHKFLILFMVAHTCRIFFFPLSLMVWTHLCGLSQITGSCQTGSRIMGYQITWSGFGLWVSVP